jgi:hypothetical protein
MKIDASSRCSIRGGLGSGGAFVSAFSALLFAGSDAVGVKPRDSTGLMERFDSTGAISALASLVEPGVIEACRRGANGDCAVSGAGLKARLALNFETARIRLPIERRAETRTIAPVVSWATAVSWRANMAATRRGFRSGGVGARGRLVILAP